MDDDATQASVDNDATLRNADDDATLYVPREESSAHDADVLPPGTVLKDRFVLEHPLGRGGMGVVYRARDLRKEEAKDRDPYVALKVLSAEFQRDQRMAIALQREARKAQTLAHPNIATVYDFDRDDERVYLTMEVLDGQPLDQVIAEHPEGLPRNEALSIIRGLCLGLAYAHNKNIVHSDFKPGNIFLTASGQIKILDFGIARAAPVERGEASDVTQFDAGELGALTPSYAACEMFEGKAPHPADDVYALAVVAYELLSGRHPFNRQPAPLARKAGLEPEPIRGLKRREWRAIRHGLAFDRDQRSQHAAEFLREFEGGSRLKWAIAALVLLAVGFTGYVGYVELEERARAAPDVPFTQLPAEVQSEFNRLIEEGDTFLGFGDAGSALMLYRSAYELHPRNPVAVQRLEDLFVTIVEPALASGDPSDARRVAENLDALLETDDFLRTRPRLLTVRNRLSAVRTD